MIIYIQENFQNFPTKNIKIGNILKINVNSKSSLNKNFNKIKIDYVFHFAALVGVQRTLKNPKKVFKDIDGIKNIIDLSIKKKIKKFFFPLLQKFMEKQPDFLKMRIALH